MTLYPAAWIGLDRGHEAAWAEDLWGEVIRVVAAHEPVGYRDHNSPLYADLEYQFPRVKWRTLDAPSESDARVFFRDAQEPWVKTGTLEFNHGPGTVRTTPLGRGFVAGATSLEQIWIRAMNAHVEERSDGVTEFPFRILSAALEEARNLPSLTLGQVDMGIMQGWRVGDAVAHSIQPYADHDSSPTTKRRLRHMLKMLETVHAVSEVAPGRWHADSPAAIRQLLDPRYQVSDQVQELTAGSSGDQKVQTGSHLGEINRTGASVFRLEQGPLRRRVVPGPTGICAICAREFSSMLLVAAHIKPRSECSETELRDLDHIAVPMCLFGCDALFERGWISVSPEGEIKVSDLVDFDESVKLYVQNHVNGRRTSAKLAGRESYFKWHWDYKFKRI